MDDPHEKKNRSAAASTSSTPDETYPCPALGSTATHIQWKCHATDSSGSDAITMTIDKKMMN
eukprot:10581428-Ditylum_brightwellii.AAC.1